MKKRLISLIIVVLLVLSPFVNAQINETDTCTGFLNTLQCFFFGDANARPVAGAAWHDRGISLPWYNPEGWALVGKNILLMRFGAGCVV